MPDQPVQKSASETAAYIAHSTDVPTTNAQNTLLALVESAGIQRNTIDIDYIHRVIRHLDKY